MSLFLSRKSVVLACVMVGAATCFSLSAAAADLAARAAEAPAGAAGDGAQGCDVQGAEREGDSAGDVFNREPLVEQRAARPALCAATLHARRLVGMTGAIEGDLQPAFRPAMNVEYDMAFCRVAAPMRVIAGARGLRSRLQRDAWPSTDVAGVLLQNPPDFFAELCLRILVVGAQKPSHAWWVSEQYC